MRPWGLGAMRCRPAAAGSSAQPYGRVMCWYCGVSVPGHGGGGWRSGDPLRWQELPPPPRASGNPALLCHEAARYAHEVSALRYPQLVPCVRACFFSHTDPPIPNQPDFLFRQKVSPPSHYRGMPRGGGGGGQEVEQQCALPTP